MVKLIKSKNKLKPNLENYYEIYKKFEWKDAEKLVDFFDKKKTQLNIAYNAVTRHAINTNLKTKIALHWESADGKFKDFTFSDLEKESNKFANLLKKLGIRKGDRCFIFLPRMPELYFSFLGILKIGAIAGTLFPAFGPEGIESRLRKGEVKLLVTNSELLKRLYKTKNLPKLKYVVVVDKITKNKAIKKKWKEISYDEVEKLSSRFEIIKTNKNDAAIMLFTSGTAGTPVAGIVLSHKATIQQLITALWVLDLHSEDIYWCTSDPGWITGIVYGIIAPFSLGITTITYEGRFDAEKWYKIIEKNKVSVIYTAPTAIRMLMTKTNYKKYNLSSVRHVCSVGEALNPAAIKWGKKVFKTFIYDSYWQTETGAIVIANYRSVPIKMGSMGKPVPGIKATIIDEKDKKEIGPNKTGLLALKPDWPSMMSQIWKNSKLYKSYFIKDKKGKKWYITKDLAYKDKEGYYFFVSRADEVIKTSGERVNPFEIENVLIEHPKIVEAAVVGKPDPLRGEIVVAFVVLKKEIKGNKHKKLEKIKEKLRENIVLFVKKKLAGHAYPKEIYFVPELPKTRSGKIMRSILKSLIKKELIKKENFEALSNPDCLIKIKKAINKI